MNLCNDIQTKAKVNIQYSGIVEEEQIYFHPDDEIDEKTHWQQKDNIRNQTQTETHNEPENEVTEPQNIHKPTAGTIKYRDRGFRENAKFRLEQNNDPLLRNRRANIEGKSFDESAFTQNNRYQHYLQNKPRIEFREDILAREYHNDNGQCSDYQILLPKQLLEEFLQAFLGHIANYPGITKMIQQA